MNRNIRALIALPLLGILLAAGTGLLQSGVYGLTIFVIHPILLGALAAWVMRPSTGGHAASYGMLLVLAATLFLLIAGFEGMICVALCLPLTLPLGALGGWLMYRCSRSVLAARGGAAMLLILPPATFTFDTHASPDIYAVRTAIEIAAPPDRVWQSILTMSKLPDPQEWYFRAGMAYPTDVHLDGTGVGATRTCDFSTGAVVESIEVWDAPRVLRFRVLQNPAPMRELTLYGEISPRHLHGYLISREGEFRLTRLPGNRTLLEGTSWYQHGLYPAPYWRVWSDAIFHRIHLRVFDRIKRAAEA